MAHIDQGVDPPNITWEPVETTVAHLLEYVTPRKVQFKSVTLDVSLDLDRWTDVSPRGAATDEEEGGLS
jgi:hypothetical protein